MLPVIQILNLHLHITSSHTYMRKIIKIIKRVKFHIQVKHYICKFTLSDQFTDAVLLMLSIVEIYL